MSRLITIAIALLLSGCAVNGDWSSRDTALEISYQVVNAMDAASTARIEDTPDWTPVDGTNYIAFVSDLGDPQELAREENIGELINDATDFDQRFGK